jgi:hypothetical protein
MGSPGISIAIASSEICLFVVILVSLSCRHASRCPASRVYVPSVSFDASASTPAPTLGLVFGAIAML